MPETETSPQTQPPGSEKTSNGDSAAPQSEKVTAPQVEDPFANP